MNSESFKDKYNLIDCWMLWLRNIEQQEQSKKEMLQFLGSLKADIAALKKHIAMKKEKACSSYDKGEIILMSNEACRLKRLHAGASSFQRFYQDEEVQLGDGTLFTEAVESENDSGDEDVTDEDVTDNEVTDDED